MHSTATDFERYRYGFGLTGRIMYFLQQTDPRIIMLALTIMFTLVVLTLMGRRMPLLFALLVCQVFAGSAFASLDAAAGVARMAIIALLCLQVIKLKHGPGWGLALFGAYVLIGLPQSVASQDLLWSIQWGGILFGTVLVSWTMGDAVNQRQDVRTLFVTFLLAGLIWTLLGTVSIRELARGAGGGERFAALSDSVGAFADTGGISMPFLLWGALRPWSRWRRIACGLAFVAATIVLISIGQRGGLFAGIIACLPQVARLNFPRIALALVIVAATGLFTLVFLSFNEKHADFLASRYFSTDLSNRDVIWRQGLAACMESPIVGHGFGANRREMREHIRNMKGTHNMYLSIWFDTGLVGLIPFVASMVVTGWQAARLSLKAHDREIQDLARICLGMIGAIMAAGFFSTWASSPSGLGTITLLISMAVTQRLAVIERTEAAQLAQQQWLLQQQRILAWKRSLQPALIPAAAVSVRTAARAR